MAVVYSIIIPAYNEEVWLQKSLPALQAAMREVKEQGEIIVVDNASEDGSAAVAGRFGVQVVFEPVRQISRARNKGASAALGRYFIFVDADSLVSAGLLKTALTCLSDGGCCGGGASVALDEPAGFLAGLFVRAWNYVSRRFKLAAGSFIYCLKEGFYAAGGFSENLYASEEIWFSRALRSWGKKQGLGFCLIERYPIVTSYRKLKHPFQLALTMVILGIFPFAVRCRPLCWFWYRRPLK